MSPPVHPGGPRSGLSFSQTRSECTQLQVGPGDLPLSVYHSNVALDPRPPSLSLERRSPEGIRVSRVRRSDTLGAYQSFSPDTSLSDDHTTALFEHHFEQRFVGVLGRSFCRQVHATTSPYHSAGYRWLAVNFLA
jgi:hypothetical protein